VLTVVVIEDVHWADESTLDLLSFLGRRLSRLRGLLLVSYRDDEAGYDHPRRMVLGDVATQRSTRRMGLPPLSAEAVQALAGPGEVDAADLYRATGEDGIGLIEQGLRIALDAHLYEQAGSAYVNIHDCCVSLQRLDGRGIRRAGRSDTRRHAGVESRTEVVTSQFSYSSRSQPSRRVISR
jgi:hypothetical protein